MNSPSSGFESQSVPVPDGPAPGNALARWMNQSLATRLIAMVLGLLLVLQLFSFGAIRHSLQSHARKVLPAQLETADHVLHSVLNQRYSALAASARVIANDTAFKEVAAGEIKPEDLETVQSAMENFGDRLGAKTVGLLDPQFKLVAYAGEPNNMLVANLPRLAALLKPSAAANKDGGHLVLVGGRLHQLVMAEMRSARTVKKYVLMSVPLDKSVLVDLRELSSQHFSLLMRNTGESAWTLAMSSLPEKQATELSRLPWSPNTLARGHLQENEAAGEMLAVRTSPLSAGLDEGGPSAAGPKQSSEFLGLITASIDDATRLNSELQWGLLLITLIGFMAFSVVSIYTARRITNPLRDLTQAAERLGAGDLNTPMRRVRRIDEIGTLAVAFERMRVNVADKQQEIEKLAYWDSLTGLPNRVQFTQAVAAAIDHAEAEGRGGVAVIMLDLDRFKHVNDVLGYRLGDLLLASLADRLKEHGVRGQDMVARLSGDEFAVLLHHGDATMAQTVAARIAHGFETPLELEEHTVDMGAGIGMACWPDHASDAETLLSRAEVAMYTAKRRTSGPMMYDASIDASSAQTLSLLSELRHAVEHGELRLFLQPKLGLANGAVVGAETLVRWMHPARGMVPPMQFIPFAEQTGYIRKLTVWIFEEAARHWTALNAEGLALTLSVNLSTRDLLDQDLPQKFATMLATHAVPASAFCLEITESAIMDDPQRALQTLERLSAQGFKLSIDDFGTGYSSLAYLKRLPVNELKIDKSFVMSMETDLDDRKIVRSTIDLAHNLGLTVVAEGVENAKIWDLLRELDCDQAQGYHMGRPMPASDFGRWAASWESRRAGSSSPDGAGAAASAVLH